VGASNQTTLSSTGFNRAGSIRPFSFFSFYLISATEKGGREEEPEIAPGGGRGGGVQGRQGGRQSAAPAEDARGHERRAWPWRSPRRMRQDGGEGR
jgi:hypothetical protein